MRLDGNGLGFSTRGDDSNAPLPNDKPVHLSSFDDENLMHDAVAGRSASGILDVIDQMPIDWFSKSQNQVKPATHGSEPVAA